MVKLDVRLFRLQGMIRGDIVISDCVLTILKKVFVVVVVVVGRWILSSSSF